MTMRVSAIVLLAGLLAGTTLAQALPAQQSVPDPFDGLRPIGTMSELMVHLIYPTSNAVFYILTRTPTTDAEWGVLEGQTLMLAESANLLMMPSRARGREQWIADALLLLNVGEDALEAAQERDVDALEALNAPLYESCVTCHQHFRSGYPRRR
jgi:hypothetical protein